MLCNEIASLLQRRNSHLHSRIRHASNAQGTSEPLSSDLAQQLESNSATYIHTVEAKESEISNPRAKELNSTDQSSLSVNIHRIQIAAASLEDKLTEIEAALRILRRDVADTRQAWTLTRASLEKAVKEGSVEKIPSTRDDERRATADPGVESAHGRARRYVGEEMSSSV